MAIANFGNIISFIFGGTQNPKRLITASDLNQVINQINFSRGGSTITVIYEFTGTAFVPTLTPIHVLGDPGLPTNNLSCECNFAGGGRAPYIHTNGLRSCMGCWIKTTTSADASNHVVTLPTTITDDAGFPIKDFNVIVSNPNYAVNIGITKISNQSFSIDIFDIATHSIVYNNWPLGVRLNITYWFGNTTEGFT